MSNFFVLMGSVHKFLPFGSIFYLTLTSWAMTFPWLGHWLWRSSSQRKFLDSNGEGKSSLSFHKDPLMLSFQQNADLCQ